MWFMTAGWPCSFLEDYTILEGFCGIVPVCFAFLLSIMLCLYCESVVCVPISFL